jgi:hypothetical protein
MWSVCLVPAPLTQREICPVIGFLVRPPVPPVPSTVIFFQTFPLSRAILSAPFFESVYTTVGKLLKVVLVTLFPSAALSRTGCLWNYRTSLRSI